MSTKTELGSSIQQHLSSKNYFGYGSSSKRNVSAVAITQATYIYLLCWWAVDLFSALHTQK